MSRLSVFECGFRTVHLPLVITRLNQAAVDGGVSMCAAPSHTGVNGVFLDFTDSDVAAKFLAKANISDALYELIPFNGGDSVRVGFDNVGLNSVGGTAMGLPIHEVLVSALSLYALSECDSAAFSK